MSASHNITSRQPEHGQHAPKRARPSVMSTSHNVYKRFSDRLITPAATLGVRTGVRIVGQPRQVLRKPAVEPALRRGKPFDSTRMLSPVSLEIRFAPRLDEAQVEHVAVRSVDACPRHGRGVYAQVAEGGFAVWGIAACSGYRRTLRLQGKHEALCVARLVTAASHLGTRHL